MALDVRQLYEDYGINWSDCGKEVTRGWINCKCPFCGDTKMHLGYSPELDMFSCWKCGIHNLQKTLVAILGISFVEVNEIKKTYKDFSIKTIERKKCTKKNLELPKHFDKMPKAHRKYIQSRGFDPETLINQYGVVATGRFIDTYHDRIIFPIYYKGKLVSFHSRDITGQHQLKALACNSDDEVIRHKETIYNFDNITKVAILSEAPLDSMRWGYDLGIATYGIRFTEMQIKLLSTIPHLFIAYDSGEGEYIAQKQAQRIADYCGIYKPIHIINDLGCDPADLSPKSALSIKRKVLRFVRNSSC